MKPLPQIPVSDLTFWRWVQRHLANFEVVSAIPTVDDLKNGDSIIYESGSTRRLYFNIDGTIYYITVENGDMVLSSAAIPDNALLSGDGGNRNIQATIWTVPLAEGDARQFFQTDGAGTISWAHPAVCDVKRTPKVADSMVVTTGTLTDGLVADTRVWQDGNVVNVTEVTGVPGFDVLFTFTNITDFCFIGISAYYKGSATHWCEIQIWDDANSVRRMLWTFSSGLGLNYRFSDLPVALATRADYINGSNEVKIRFYHPPTGNASHDLFIDYVSIIG